MDKKLLEALNNLSFALEELSMAMQDSSKDKNKSATSTALTSGKIEKKIDAIDKGVKQLQTDNKKILKNQEQLIKLAKEQKSGGGAVGDASDPKQRNKIKDGLATIMMIAVGVLAIGLAFKIVGAVNFASVIALAIALPLVAIAFERIAKLKDLKPAQMKTVLLVVLVMSAAIAASSYILNMVQPVGIFKLITATFIGATFTALSYGLPKLLQGFEKVSPMGVGKMILFGPAVLLAMSTAIALSSYALGMVQPVGIFKLITAVFIAGAFAALGYGLGKILDAFANMKVNPAKAAAAALLMPIVFVGLSLAIAGASLAFQMIKPVGLFKLITAALIGVVFIPLSYALPFLATAMSKITIKQALLMPVVLVLLAAAIYGTSILFNMTEQVPFGKLFNIIFQSVTLAAIAATMFVAMKFASKIGIGNAVKGGVVLVILSAVIMATSLILGVGTYKNYPTLRWILEVGVALTAFTIAAVALGILVFGPQALVVAAGAAAIVVLAGVILATSAILNKGQYKTYPTLLWNLYTLGSITAFATASLAIGLLLFGPQAALAALGAAAMLGVAMTIVEVSNVLAKGTYDVKGFSSWATATALLFTVFTPIMLVLGAVAIANEVAKAFGANPWEGAKKMILGIAQTIVDVSGVLSAGNFSGGPTPEWARGIAIALGAFSPIYSMLVKSKVLEAFGLGGVGPDDFNNAIRTIVGGIKFASEAFAGFSEKNAPSKTWAEGVGGAISAFSPALEFISKNSGWLGADTSLIEKAIEATTRAIVNSANTLAGGDYKNTVDQNWSNNVSNTIRSFVEIVSYIEARKKWLPGAIRKFDTTTKSILGTAKRFKQISNNMKNVDEKFMINIDTNVRKYVELAKWLSESKVKGAAVVNTVDNMKKVAKSYSQMAQAVQKLNASLEELDVEKLNALKNLNASVILMSLMDPEQFKSMMTQLEEKGGVLVDALQDLESKEAAPTGKGAPSPQVKTGGGAPAAPQRTMSDLYSIMESVDAKLASIDKSSDKLSKYVDEIRGDDPLVKKRK